MPPEFEAFATGDLRKNMIEYIRKHFGDLLGPHAALLDEPGGLDTLAEMIRTGKLGKSSDYSRAA